MLPPERLLLPVLARLPEERVPVERLPVERLLVLLERLVLLREPVPLRLLLLVLRDPPLLVRDPVPVRLLLPELRDVPDPGPDRLDVLRVPVEELRLLELPLRDPPEVLRDPLEELRPLDELLLPPLILRPVSALITSLPRSSAAWCRPHNERDGGLVSLVHCVPLAVRALH